MWTSSPRVLADGGDAAGIRAVRLGAAAAGAAIKTAAPTNTYPCADGKWLCVAGNSDLIFKRLMKAIGRPEMAADPRFATNGGRCANVAEIDAAIAAWTRTLPAAEAEAILEAAEVPCSRLYDMADCARTRISARARR
jgi:crotonobetainyl-CoA:carnitine CoA-transferase CaiB-like acyl-CoA transferase